MVYSVTVNTETSTARLSLLVNFCAPNANVAQYVMFVPCPFARERCWLYTLCWSLYKRAYADMVDYGKYCIGKARSKILLVIWEEERIFAVHIGILKTRWCIELNDCTSSVTGG